MVMAAYFDLNDFQELARDVVCNDISQCRPRKIDSVNTSPFPNRNLLISTPVGITTKTAATRKLIYSGEGQRIDEKTHMSMWICWVAFLLGKEMKAYNSTILHTFFVPEFAHCL